MTEGLKPFIVIVFPNWNGREDTLECLDSLRQLDYPKDRLEIIISDNGSTDGSIEAIREKFAVMQTEGYFSLKIVENGRNIGAPAAYNKGLEKALGDYKYILKLDNDVVLANDCLKILSEYLEQDLEAGIVGPRVYYYKYPERVAHGAGYLGFWNLQRYSQDKDEVSKATHLIGCCILVRKEIVEKQGFFLDENYFVYLDDTDVCLFAHKIGYDVIYNPYAHCWHKTSMSTGGHRSSFAIYHDFRSKLYIIHKYASNSSILLFWLLFPIVLIRSNRGYWHFTPLLLATHDFLLRRFGSRGHY